VCQTPGQPWTRLKQGDETQTPDGRRQLSWSIPHPAPLVDVAFCFPYGPADVDQLLDRSRDYWQSAAIGLSQEGRRVLRLHNSVGTPGGTQPGIYLVARQHAGETPGSWVLDGFLRQLAQTRKAGYIIWAVPLADIDGVVHGYYGRDGSPFDLDRAWGVPPLRREARVIRQDILRWKARCRPLLALDLQAPGACERDGVRVCMSRQPEAPMAAEETKWCNVIQNEVQAEFAAPEFKRPPGATPGFVDVMRDEIGVPALIVETPYSHAAGAVLTQKSYREIGRRLALAVLRRHG
jgi:predicted deacylase